GGDRRAVVEFVIFAQVENPRRRVLRLPALRETALEIAFAVVVRAEGAGHLAENAVEQRNAVGVGIVALDGFRYPDGDACLRCDGAAVQEPGEGREERR